MTAAQNAYCFAFCIKRASVRIDIDTRRTSAYNTYSCLCKVARKLKRHCFPFRAGFSHANNAYAKRLCKHGLLPFDVKHRRRINDILKLRRIRLVCIRYYLNITLFTAFYYSIRLIERYIAQMFFTAGLKSATLIRAFLLAI